MSINFRTKIALSDMQKGLMLTYKNVHYRKVTLHYPFEKGTICTRFRSEYNAICVACKLCVIKLVHKINGRCISKHMTNIKQLHIKND